MTQIYSSPCYLTTKSAPPTTHTHTYIYIDSRPPPPLLHTDTLPGHGGGVSRQRGRTVAVRSLLLPHRASACLVMCCRRRFRESRSNRRGERPLATTPSLSTVLFLIEHICGMRGLSLGGAMAADPSELLTQDQSAEKKL